MSRRQLEMFVTLPWLAASVVMLIMTRIDGETQEAKLGLIGSAAICFSIGCLARTSLGLHDSAATKSVPSEAPEAKPR